MSTRATFMAMLAGAAVPALVAIPALSKASAGDVGLRHRLPPNALIKWERIKEWTDEFTGISHCQYSIRYTVVPDAFLPCEIDKRPFVTILPTKTLPDGRVVEDMPWTFTFVTYAARASGRDAIRRMRREIQSGTIVPRFKMEGEIAPGFIPNNTANCFFVDMVHWQAKYQNADYAFFQKHGCHADPMRLIAMIGTR
jgi:hypothetical protein